jgi:transcription antitermination factor NusG
MPTTASCPTETLAGVADRIDAMEAESRWHVLWTRSHCEQLVHDRLSSKGFESFLPKIGQWSRRKGLRYLAQVPMFPGYLFLHHAIDKTSYIEVCKTRGLVRILGARWDHLGTVPDREMEAIQKVIGADLPAMPHPYLREGQRVRVVRGPLASAEGILVKSEPKKGLLVLSVELLQRSVGVEIDCTLVNPV